MPVTINDIEIMGDDGKFTEDFSPELLGDDYKETKVFEKTPDIISLAKAYADTKSAFGAKLEGVIQKPKKDATDKEKAEYQKTLLKELGAPDKPEEYEFVKPEGLPDEYWSQDLVNLFRQSFFDVGISKSQAKFLVDKWNGFQGAQIKAQTQAQIDALEEKYNVESKSFKDVHKGDKQVSGCRTAFNAIMQFADEPLTKLLKDNKISDDVGNLDKWRQLGFMPRDIALWENIGTKMKSDTAITNEGTQTVKKPTAPKGRSEETQKLIEDVYDHPTSKDLVSPPEKE